jgi:carboxylesterase type B
MDSDLLSLDIPAPPHAENAPVVMWVHGGGYIIGNKANHRENKIRLFNGQGWIFVSVNTAYLSHRKRKLALSATFDSALYA